jgi:hypothetical protein
LDLSTRPDPKANINGHNTAFWKSPLVEALSIPDFEATTE